MVLDAHPTLASTVRGECRKFVMRVLESRRPFTVEGLYRQTGRVVPIEDIDGWVQDWKRQQTALPEPLPRSTVMAFLADRGSGKSLVAAWMAYKRYRMGHPVFYNPKGLLNFPPMKGGVCEFMPIKQLAMLDERIENGVIFWDEVQRTLNKFRMQSVVSRLLNGALQQTRKLGLDLLLTSNSIQSLDPILQEQINFHVKFDEKLEQRLEQRIPNGDFVIVQFCDTHGKYGKGPARFIRGREIDNRLRFPRRITKLADMFKFYNTHAIAEPVETMGFTAEDMRQAQDEKATGVKMDELVRWVVYELVPTALEAGATVMVPNTAVEWIAEQFGHWDHAACCGSSETTNEVATIHKDTRLFVKCTSGTKAPFEIKPEFLTAALRAAGLKSRGGRTAALQFILPPSAMLPLFQRGMWSPDE